MLPARTLRNHADGSQVTSLDFSDSGHWCVSAGTDESIQVYDCIEGIYSKTVMSKKYGANLARFTHHSHNCVFASTKEQDTIRYLNLHDNTFVRYFKGHKNRVVALEVSPVDDTLLSAALDRSVRLWDLRSPNCQGIITVATPAYATFDATGTVFAIASQELRTVALYDVRNFDKDPFVKFRADVDGSWQKIEFSNNGSWLCVSSTGRTHGIFDAFNGNHLAELTGHTPLQRPLPSTSPTAFTVDGQHLYGGSNDSTLCVWDMGKVPKKGGPVVLNPDQVVECNHIPSLIAFNPRVNMMATADQSVTLWLPDH